MQRLPVYLNYLKAGGGDGYVSSGTIARALGMGEVLVRKDLAHTSATGKTRVGYRRGELIEAIENCLGCRTRRTAVIFGAGGLGRALLSYGGFANYGIEIVAAFDSDPAKAGGSVAGKPVYLPAEAERVIGESGARLAVLCVPASAAQAAADMLVRCGIAAILNFAAVILKVPADVSVRNIDVAANLAIASSGIKEE